MLIMDDAAIEVIVNVGAVLGSHAGDEERAEEVLDLLRKVIPWDAAGINSIPVLGEQAQCLAAPDTPEPLRVAYGLMTVRDRPELRTLERVYESVATIDDVPGARELPLVTEVVVPAGLNQVATAMVRDDRGLVQGMIICCFADPADLRPAHLELLDALGRMVHGLVDPWRTPRSALAGLPGHRAAVLPDGDCWEVPGHGPGEWLVPYGRLSREVAALAAVRALPRSFWWQDPDGVFHRVITAPIRGAVVVVESVEPLPHGLSAREAGVLRAMMTGLTNRQIAHRLFVSPATVAKHVSHIHAKLGVGGRAGAVCRAVDLGLLPL
ncbi:LuxR family transcriptional regulator [Pseudonocardiaceae bacterium YIM PH 21723]|nr:LuxR family transcriptional regulator [Pseudonocardiaceae bacterium YIM PH 21723]